MIAKMKKIIRKVKKMFRKRVSTETAPCTGTYEVLSHLHNVVKPKTYLEIGVQAGHSIVQSRKDTLVLGVDPADNIIYKLPKNIKMFFETSDKFFARKNVSKLLKNNCLDLSFIDGMHLFEYVLRDFINTERLCSEKSLITLHDCIPIDAYIASRTPHGGPWTGDVFKIVLILKKYRPDLKIYNYSQLCVVSNVDPKSTVLSDKYDEILNEYMNLTYEDVEKDMTELLSIRSLSQEATKDELSQLVKELFA